MWPFTHRAMALLCQTLKPQCPLSSNESSTVTEDCQLKRRHWDTNVIKAPLVDRHPYHRCQSQKLYLLELSVQAWWINLFWHEQHDQVVVLFSLFFFIAMIGVYMNRAKGLRLGCNILCTDWSDCEIFSRFCLVTILCSIRSFRKTFKDLDL